MYLQSEKNIPFGVFCVLPFGGKTRSGKDRVLYRPRFQSVQNDKARTKSDSDFFGGDKEFTDGGSENSETERYCTTIEQSVNLMPGEKIGSLFAEMDGLRKKYTALKSQL